MTLSQFFQSLKDKAPEFIASKRLEGRELDDFQRALRVLSEASLKFENEGYVGNKPIGYALMRLREITDQTDFLDGLENADRFLEFMKLDPKSMKTPVGDR